MNEAMNEDFVESLQTACGVQRYPEEFLAEYEPFECFAHNDFCETLLVKHRETGLFYVAKCYRKAATPFPTSEGRILKSLSHPGLPRFVGEYENGDFLCVVREYVEGTPLGRYVARYRPGAEKAVEMAVALCDILAYLHGRTPPVIHRDIKPQNLIVDHRGELWLIDFGISRVFEQGKGEDTVSCCTKNFSAPEQYGYAQTDHRADIFSLGILLGWLLTGECRRDLILPSVSNPRLRRIVEKCTAFAPRDRYPTAARVRADLLALDGRRHRSTLSWTLAALACMLCLCSGFGLGQYAERNGFLRDAGAVAFREPLVERAVRLTLGIQKDEPITEKDLLSMTALFICGDQALGDGESYDSLIRRLADKELPSQNGGMTSLADVARLKNLTILHIAAQNITDLTPLMELTALRNVDLRHNPVSDLTPLGFLPYLSEVCLFGTRAQDLSALDDCPLLWRIDAGGSFVTSLSSLRSILDLKSLDLYKAPLHTLQDAGELSSLEQLSLSEVADGDLSPLLSHSTLKELELAESLRSNAQEQLGQASFQILYR
jgi:tRNA A-37 threonylcarbamoyl transferase component Bud32